MSNFDKIILPPYGKPSRVLMKLRSKLINEIQGPDLLTIEKGEIYMSIKDFIYVLFGKSKVMSTLNEIHNDVIDLKTSINFLRAECDKNSTDIAQLRTFLTSRIWLAEEAIRKISGKTTIEFREEDKKNEEEKTDKDTFMCGNMGNSFGNMLGGQESPSLREMGSHFGQLGKQVMNKEEKDKEEKK